MEISILMVDDDRILVEKLEETVDWKRIGISWFLQQIISVRLRKF